MAYTEEQLKEAARKALAAGDNAAAKRLIDAARAAGAAAQTAPAASPMQAGLSDLSELTQGTMTGQAPSVPTDARGYMEARARGEMPAPLPMSDEQRARQAGIDNATQRQGTGRAAATGALRGATFEFADEAAARLMALHPGITFDQAVKFVRADMEASQNMNPGATLAGQIGGAVAMPGQAAANFVGRGGGLGSQAVRGALVGAGYGGATGFGEGEGGAQERLSTAVPAAAIGAGLGGASAGLVGILQKALQSRAAKKALMASAPTQDDLRSAASRVFQQADNAQLPRQPLTQAAPGIIGNAQRAGMDDMLTPQAARAASRIEEAATDPSATIAFRELDILRRQAQVPAGNISNKIESSIGSRLVDDLDDVVGAADDKLGADVADARKMWGMLRRSEAIDTVIAKAENHPSGFAQGLQTEIRGLLNNPKRLRGFSGDEIAEMKRILTRVSPKSVAAAIGKFGPRLTGNGNVVGGIGGAILGGAIGNTLGAVAVPAVGSMAHIAANKLAERQAAVLSALVRSGGKLPSGATKANSAVTQALRALMLGNSGATAEATRNQLGLSLPR